MPIALGYHNRGYSFAAVVNSVDVDLQESTHLINVENVDRPVESATPVVDHHIDLTKLLYGALDKHPNLGFVGDVSGDAERFDVKGATLGLDFPKFISATCSENYSVSHTGKIKGEGFANSCGRFCHNRHSSALCCRSCSIEISIRVPKFMNPLAVNPTHISVCLPRQNLVHFCKKAVAEGEE